MLQEKQDRTVKKYLFWYGDIYKICDQDNEICNIFISLTRSNFLKGSGSLNGQLPLPRPLQATVLLLFYSCSFTGALLFLRNHRWKLENNLSAVKLNVDLPCKMKHCMTRRAVYYVLWNRILHSIVQESCHLYGNLKLALDDYIRIQISSRRHCR